MRGPEDLGVRTKRFALQIIGLFGRLPARDEARVLGRQLLRSGTSVGAQYREARRARSDAEFVSKMSSSQQELEETAYWLELLIAGNIAPDSVVRPLHNEADELLAIYSTIIRKTKARLR